MAAPPAHTAHSPRSPSGIHRWAHCLGSIEAQAGVPDETSPYAAEGTLFHTIMAACLDRPILEPSDFLNEERVIDGHPVVCDREMVRHLEDGLDWVAEQPGKLFVEKRVKLDRWMPGESGTTDIGLVDTEAMRITIADWKYGSEPVEAERNEQLQAYALGFWNWYVNRFDVDPLWSDRRLAFRIVVRQPRVSGGGGVWDTTLGTLLDFGDWLADRHAASLAGGPRLAGKKQCRWCKVRSSCTAHQDFVLGLIGAKLDGLQGVDLDPPKAGIITPAQRSIILLNWSMVERWRKDLHADALNDALKGRPVPHMKVVKGRAGSREWRDPEAAKQAMLRIDELPGDKIFKMVLASPTEIEKEITRSEYKKLAHLVMQADPKPVLVDEKEKGESYTDYQDKLLKLEK